MGFMYFFDCGSCMVPAQKTHILQSYFIKTPSVTPLLPFKDLFVVRNTNLFSQRVINMHRILAEPLNRSKNLPFQDYYSAIYRYPAEAYKLKWRIFVFGIQERGKFAFRCLLNITHLLFLTFWLHLPKQYCLKLILQLKGFQRKVVVIKHMVMFYTIWTGVMTKIIYLRKHDKSD